MPVTPYTTEFNLVESGDGFRVNIPPQYTFFEKLSCNLNKTNMRYLDLINIIRKHTFPKSSAELISQTIKDIDDMYNADLTAIKDDIIWHLL